MNGHKWEWSGNTLAIAYDQYGVWLLTLATADGRRSELHSTNPHFLATVAEEFVKDSKNMITWRYGK